MIRLILNCLGVMAFLAFIGLASLFSTGYTPTYNDGWCAGFKEAELEARSRGLPISKRATPRERGFTVRLDDDRLVECE